MKNMRLADEFGGITGVHRTVMHPYMQDKPISTHSAPDSDKLDKSTGMCVIIPEFGDSKNTDKLEANMVVYCVIISCSDTWYADYTVSSIHASEQGAKDAVEAIWQHRIAKYGAYPEDREAEMADVSIMKREVKA